MSEKRKACFICGTPFHVITSIILRYQLNIKSDIIIYDAFENAELLKKNLLNEGIFENARIISREKDYGLPQSRVANYIYALKGYLTIKRTISNRLPEVTNYTDVFFANDQVTDTIDRLNYCYIKKYYPDIMIHFMADGLGSYHDSYYNLTRLDYIFRKYVVRGKTHILDSNIYLYRSELYYRINPNGVRKIKQIQTPDCNVIEILKKVFSYIKEDVSDYDTIVFDTVREEEFIKGGNGEYNRIVDKIVGKRKAIVKSHPREKKRYFKFDYFKTEGFPFEVLCLYNNFDKYTFINNYSNAVFTPKLLFDQEPQIIFTYKCLLEKMIDKNKDKDLLVSCFKDMYCDKDKIVLMGETVE